MVTDIQDRDNIVSQALSIPSAEERDAYISRACGNDAGLRRQVEDQVAAHLQAGGPEKPDVLAASTSLPLGGSPEQDGPIPAQTREVETSNLVPKKTRSLRVVGALIALLATILLLTSLIVWTWHSKVDQGREVQQAQRERDQAQKDEAAIKKQLEKVLSARQVTAAERDRALAVEKAARRSEQDSKIVLAFLQNNLLSAGHPMGWGGGQKKDVTLRQAVDAAESKVDETFADRPLVEASIRFILGSTYLDLGEPARAIQQYERALALREADLGPDHPDTGVCRNKLAVAYRLAGRIDDASRLFDQNRLSSSHAAALSVQGSALLAEKKPYEAELKLRECLAIRQKIQPDDWTTFDAKAMLGAALLDQKKYAEAESLLVSGYEGMKDRKTHIPIQHWGRLTKALERLVRLFESWGKPDEASRWRKELEMTEAAKKP